MKSMRAKSTDKSSTLNVKGAKAIFENGMKRQRAPSPAPVSMSARTPLTNKKAVIGSSGSVSSYKERFEIFTAPKSEAVSSPKNNLRRAASEDNVATGGNSVHKPRERTRSNSGAERHWFHARTKIYEQLSGKRSQSDKDLRINVDSAKSTPTLERKALAGERSSSLAILADGDKVETTSISERINRYKSDVETKKTNSEKCLEPGEGGKQSVKVKDIQTNFTATQPSHVTNKLKSMGFLEKCKKLEHQSTDQASAPPVGALNVAGNDMSSTGFKCGIEIPSSSTDRSTHVTQKQNININTAPKMDTKKDSKTSRESANTAGESISIHNHRPKKVATDVTDHDTARAFMDELIAAIDNEQHVPMRQLIDLFEIMKKENGEMKASIKTLKLQLDKADLDTLSQALEAKLADTVEQLRLAQEQIEELSEFREALQESQERCEELEELNSQYIDEIEELKLVMNEMRDQFHDDEIHETIILQQRLDDMARSLRIIHFRLKKADAKLQETEREKETLLEEIKLLQGGAFTDEEIRRMQSLEGDLQTAKEISVELHNQLQRSEERREKLELDSTQLRKEIKAGNLENERLRNNVILLREQINEGTSKDKDRLSPVPPVNLVRQGSSFDVDTLKSNLEASIERENDIKEQLTYAEEEAKMLRKRLRDIEHENEALTKQLRKLAQVAHLKGKGTESSEHIQTEVIQLENVQLRRNNDRLHQDMDSLRAQIKSLQQKLTLVQDEQNEGPLSVSKNSLYYETKFEKMTQEIEDLRQQLQNRDSDYKKLREETTGNSKRDRLRRAITIECDSIDTKKQLDIVQQEAEQLRHKLQQLEGNDSQRITENDKQQLGCSQRNSSQGADNYQLDSDLSAAEAADAQLLAQLQTSNAAERSVQERFTELLYENSSLVSELSYYRKSRPDIAELLNKLHGSEQKILSYESEISHLRNDMQVMERSLQGDISSLTMRNTILQSLLEVIGEHEDEDKQTATSEQSTPRLANRMSGSRCEGASPLAVRRLTGSETAGSDNVIAKHINRLPHEIQCQFRKKIECLEQQLKEEREKAKAAENLLQQVKISATASTKRDPRS